MGVYVNLESEMVRKRVNRSDLAETLQVRYATVCDKLNGKSSFTLDEALKIKRKYFPRLNFENLFERENEEQKGA